MFCDQCQAFWNEALSKAKIPPVVNACQDIHWEFHDKVIYHNTRELKRGSDLQCRICRIIYSLPTKYDWAGPLKDENDPLDIVLSIDPSRGPYPVITVEFREASGKGTKLPKRSVASCTGLLDDGMRYKKVMNTS